MTERLRDVQQIDAYTTSAPSLRYDTRRSRAPLSERRVGRTLRREYVFQSSRSPESFRALLTSEHGPLLRLEHFEVRDAADDSDTNEFRFVIDWIGVHEWLDDEVRRLIRGLRGTQGWSVTRTGGCFVDLMFPPTPNIVAMMFYEHCRVEGPERYGVLARYFDGYRFYVGPRNMESDACGFLDIESSLEIAVQRIALFVRNGMGSQTNLGNQSEHPSSDNAPPP